MTKQKLEGVFSKSLSQRSDLWYIKLQVNSLAHTRTPADYLIISQNYNYLVECKQVDLRKNPKNRFTFDRLTQEQDLLYFENKFGKNKSFVLILLLNRMLKKSHFYLIPIDYYIYIKNIINKKSMNSDDMEKEFSVFKINYVNNLLEIPIK